MIPFPHAGRIKRDRKDYTILQIDAHIDWRIPIWMKIWGYLQPCGGHQKHIHTIIQVGARGIGSAHPDDMAAACAWGVKFFPAEQIMTDGIAPVLHAIPAEQDIVICFDIDALDPSLAPNTIGRTRRLDVSSCPWIDKRGGDKTRIAAMILLKSCPRRYRWHWCINRIG